MEIIEEVKNNKLSDYINYINKVDIDQLLKIVNNIETTYYIRTNNIKIRKWLLNGKLHRLNGGPAKIGCYENGNIKFKHWYQKGKLHKLNYPAKIGYYENDNKKYEKWYQYDKRHKLDGPAVINYTYV